MWGLSLKTSFFLGVFSLFGWLNTEYFLWPSMLELKKILLEENRKKKRFRIRAKAF